MTHTLVTFLGRPQHQDGRYREADYGFPGGVKRSAFFGLALAEHLKPDYIVILGTPSSMWGVLVSSLHDRSGDGSGDSKEDGFQDIMNLLDAEKDGKVTDCLLERMAPIMTRVIGRNVKPRLIPFGKDAEEQYDILQVVSDAVSSGDVSFDLTHGFRHLGMVGFLSAFMLERVAHLNVCGLWYGALDMTDSGITPVVELEGLNRVRRWVDALNRFDASGDYGVFEPLLIADGVPKDKAQCLERAAFHERTLNLSSAAQQIRVFLPILDKPLSGASGLFQKRLCDRLAWARGTDLAEHQRKLAFEYLNRHDFIRAAMFGWEALVTQECSRRNYDTSRFDERSQAIEELGSEITDECHPAWKKCAFHRLRTIRNALAHGNPPRNQRDRTILGDADKLKAELGRAFQRLLNEGSRT